MPKSKVEIYSETNKGLQRPNNEDEAGSISREDFKVVFVADGMGGHSSGEVASRIVKEALMSGLNAMPTPKNIHQAKKSLKKIIKRANSLIHKLSSKKAECYGMGTTLVLAFRMPDFTIIINCGDSRAYSFKKDNGVGLTQLTADQTIVQYLYKLGAISKEEIKTSPKRHVLMNAIGIDASVSYDVSIIDNDYDLILACSDGLTNMVTDSAIENTIVEDQEKSVEKLTKDLINQALENGGIDNIGVSIMEVR